MKNTIIGACLFLAGSIIFAACIIYPAFEGCVPSEVFGERLLSIAMLIVGGCLLALEFYRSFADKNENRTVDSAGTADTLTSQNPRHTPSERL